MKSVLKQLPRVHTPTEIQQWDCHSWNPKTSEEDNKVWEPARSENFYGLYLVQRLRIAWHVFTGRYDALDWKKNQNQNEEQNVS